MHRIVEFGKDNKWFVFSEKEINGDKYCYLIRIDNDELVEDYAVVKSVLKDGEEYMEPAEGNLDEIISILVPESLDFKDIQKLLKEIEK